MLEEPTISKELRALMDQTLNEYPHGMICTGVLAVTEPQNTVHTTFGGFNSHEDLKTSLASENAISKFLSLSNLFSNKDLILFMNKLITDGPQAKSNEDFINELEDLGLIERRNNKIQITGKGRIFVLSIYSIVS